MKNQIATQTDHVVNRLIVDWLLKVLAVARDMTIDLNISAKVDLFS